MQMGVSLQLKKCYNTIMAEENVDIFEIDEGYKPNITIEFGEQDFDNSQEYFDYLKQHS